MLVVMGQVLDALFRALRGQGKLVLERQSHAVARVLHVFTLALQSGLQQLAPLSELVFAIVEMLLSLELHLVLEALVVADGEFKIARFRLLFLYLPVVAYD